MKAGWLARLDGWWTRLELALGVAVASSLVLSLVAWVALKGLSAKTTDTFVAGALFRAVTLAAVAGATGFRLRGARWGWPAAAAGALIGWLARDLGVVYFSNIFGWLQDGSALTWCGGLRGLGTRLTLWLALLGASLATASGRHVTIDVATRALGESWRAPLARLGALVAAVVCLSSAWGFFDFIAIDGFQVAPEGSVTDKLEAVSSGVHRHLRHFGRQVRIDSHVAALVLSGHRWDTSVTASQWNEWLGDDAEYAGQRERDELAHRAPLLSLPQEASRGLLVRDFNLVLPIGLLLISLRFLLWAAMGGHVEGAHPTSEQGA